MLGFLVVCAVIFCQSTLFSHISDPIKFRDYFPPPSVPHTSYLHNNDLPTYREKFSKPTPAWLIETIQSELAFFKEHPITQKGLAATQSKIVSHGYPRTHYLRRYRIIEGKIYARGYIGVNDVETDWILRTLARMSDIVGVPQLPNVDFIINHNDGMPMHYDPPGFWITDDKNDQAPILSGGKRADAPYVVLIPHRTPMPGWTLLVNQTLQSRCPWKKKKREAAWRGNIVLNDADIWSSSDDELLDACTRAPRSVICSLSQKHPDLINAGFSANLDWIPSKNFVKAMTPFIKGHLPAAEHIRYAYLPVLDGAMISGGGYEWRLFSNSLVFKPESPFVAWFEQGLKPHVHFLPIHGNLDDLVEKILWARAHDGECEQMANNGASFAEENLRSEGQYFYIFRLLEEYEKCQAFNTKDLLEECERDTDWVRIR